MSESKRIEMQQALDTVIMKWLEDTVKEEKLREEFKQGMDRLVKNTAEDSGVWQVVCQASSVHAQRLQEFERIRTENEELKSRGAGDFKEESSRKRGRRLLYTAGIGHQRRPVCIVHRDGQARHLGARRVVPGGGRVADAQAARGPARDGLDEQAAARPDGVEHPPDVRGLAGRGVHDQ